MRFSQPGWLAVGLVASLVLVWAWYVTDARQRRALQRFIAAQLHVRLTHSMSVAKRRLQRALGLLALMLLCVALAGPLWGYRWEQVSRRGNEIVFAIDTSRSMATPDIKPDRLTRAKLAIDDFTQRLDGDAVGIVAFAGSAFLVCPITLDYGAFHESLGAIDTNTIPRGGTNIASAIHEAQVTLRRRPGSDRILILVTDGEDLEGGALDAARTAAQEDGLKIYTVGVGSAAGDLIPIPAEQGGGFVKDETGAFVKSRLDEAALQAIAAASGGFYVSLGTQGEGLTTIFTNVLGPSIKHNLASRQQKIYTERYQWPLAAALGALLTSQLIGTRRSRRSRRRVLERAAVLGCGVLMSMTVVPMGRAAAAIPPGNSASAGSTPPDSNAPALDRKAPTLDSKTPALDPKTPVLEYNAGTAAYRSGRFNEAQQAFQRSLSQTLSSDPKRLADQQDAYYNLGDTLYRAGQKTQDSAPQDTMAKWTDAIKAYDTALQLRADDADSKYNRDLVKHKLDALEQKQNPPPNPDKGKGQGQGQGQGKGQGQGEQSPPNGESPSNQPPQSPSSQNPPSASQPAQNQPRPSRDAANTATPTQNEQAARAADNQHEPGQMSREEARELLDSVKGDERPASRAPLDRRDVDDTPEKPYQNW